MDLKLELTDNLEFILKLFCIIVITALCILIYYNGKDLSCDQCVVHFRADKESIKFVTNDAIQKFDVNITLLFSTYQNGECIIKWDKNMGYIYDNSKVKQDI